MKSRHKRRHKVIDGRRNKREKLRKGNIEIKKR